MGAKIKKGGGSTQMMAFEFFSQQTLAVCNSPNIGCLQQPPLGCVGSWSVYAGNATAMCESWLCHPCEFRRLCRMVIRTARLLLMPHVWV